MKIFLAPVTLLSALFLDWAVVRGSLAGIPLSLTALGALFWLWHIGAPHARFAYAAMGGVFFDVFSLFPFGIYTAVLLLLALFTGFLKIFLANVHEKRAGWIGFTSLVASFFILMLPLSILLYKP